MLKDTLINCGAIKLGDFTLSSGKKSKYYIDIKQATTDPARLDEIATELSKHIKAKMIGGVELGAVPLLVAVSLKLNIPYVIIQKQEKEYGVKDPIGKFEKDTEIDIIEDVVTTGRSVMKAVALLRSRGAKITRAICVADREEGGKEFLKNNGVELLSAIKASELLENR